VDRGGVAEFDIPRDVVRGQDPVPGVGMGDVQVAAVVDAGELPGTPSTIIDFSGAEPRVIREGAAPAAGAIERVSAALA